MRWHDRARIVGLLCGCLAALAVPLIALAQPAGAQPSPANTALALRVADLAQEVLRAPAIGPAHLQAAAALLGAAARLDPIEPRYPRLRADALLRLGDREGAIEMLGAYRKLAPKDELAQVEQIDLYLAGLQTSDAQAEYLAGIAAAQRVPAAVRSHAAGLAAAVLAERMQPAEAVRMLEQALELNPLNLHALRLQLAGLPAELVEDRVSVLVQMIAVNPADASAQLELARTLADAGLAEESLQFSLLGMSLVGASGSPVPPQLLAEHLAALMVAGQAQPAAELSTQIAQTYPADVELGFLGLLAARMGKDAQAIERAKGVLRSALDAQAAAVLSADAPTTAPATRPAGPAPSPTDLAQRMAEPEMAGRLNAFIVAAADQAWFALYYDEQPDAAEPWIEALRAVHPESEALLARLDGWRMLLDEQPDQARQALAPVASTDPMAQMAILRLDHKQPADEQWTADAQQLLQENASGLIGATLSVAARELGVERLPGERDPVIRERLSVLPSDWDQILKAPQQVYGLHVEPVNAGVAFGEPVVLKVVLQNLSGRPLAMGPDAILRPDLWIDAQLRGVVQQHLPAVAFDRIAGPLVLEPRRIVTHLVRADQGALNRPLMSSPLPAVQIRFDLTTNPLAAQGPITVGPAGQRSQSALVQRQGLALSSAGTMQRIVTAARTGSPEQRVHSLQVAATLAGSLAAPPEAPMSPEDTAARAAAAQQFRDVVVQGANDADPSVRAWARFLGAMLGDEAAARTAAQEMAASGQPLTELLGALIVHLRALGPEAAAAVAASVKDPSVTAYAQALPELAAQPPPMTAATTQGAQAAPPPHAAPAQPAAATTQATPATAPAR